MLFDIDAIKISSFEEMEKYNQKYKNPNYDLVANIQFKDKNGTIEKGMENNYNNFLSLSYEDLWKMRQEFEGGGWYTGDNLLALLFIMDYKAALPIKRNKWVNFCYKYIAEKYSAQNILSVSSVLIDDREICSIFLFPLDRYERKFTSKQINLDGSQGHSTFIKLKNREKLNPDIVENFREAVKCKIGIFYDAEEEENIKKIRETQKEWPDLNREYEKPIILDREEEDDVEMFHFTEIPDEQIRTTLPRQDFLALQKDTIYYFTEGVERGINREAARGEIDLEGVVAKIEEYLKGRYADLSRVDSDLIIKNTLNAVFGYYILTPLIEEDAISDIRIISWNHIRVKVSGKRYTSNIAFESEEDYNSFIMRVAEKNHIDLKMRPESIFSDTVSSPSCRMRFDIQTPQITSNIYNMHIRKIPKVKRSLDDLIKLEMMPKKVANYLINKVKEATGMLICGKGASGKSTLLSALIDSIPKSASGVVIEESKELFTNTHPDILFHSVLLKEQSPNGVEIGLKELTRNALVSDEDYIIIGEVKGGEALYALNACATGAKFMCTIHSGSSRDAISKMVDYIQYDSQYTRESAEYMLKDINVVVFMKEFKVEEISEVVGWDFKNKCLKYKTVYYRDVEKYMQRKNAGLLQ